MIASRARKGLGLAILALAASLIAIALHAQTANAPKPVVIAGGTLIDGTGRAPIENAVIVIEGERIKAVGRQGEIPIPKDSHIINAKGKTLLPGLIDGHCHLVDFMGELYLHLGITTCPDITQNEDEWTLAQRDGTALGRIRGPRIWSTGIRIVGVPPSWARRVETGRLVRTAEEARAVVRRKKELGMDIIKFNEYTPPDAVRGGADEANKLGLPVTCHCLDVFLAAESHFAGVEHHWGALMTSTPDEKKRWEIHEARMTGKIDTADLPMYYQTENFDKIVKAMVDNNVSWSPTIATWFRPISPSGPRFKEEELALFKDPNASYLPGVLREQALGQYARYEGFSPERLAQAREGYGKIQDFMRRYVKAGGIIRAGSDPNNGVPGLGVIQEMVMFVESGLTPMQAIQAATLNVAKSFRKDKDFGSVEPGKHADIIAVEGDPLQDMWAVHNVRMVMLDGKLVDTALHASWRNPIPNPHPWRATPRQIEISPKAFAQGSGPATLTVTTNKGFDRFHRVTLNGKELETHFVSRSELEAVVPPSALKDVGTYPVEVISQGDFASRSTPSYLIVYISFKK
jgi:imidazolonepropionase-like amidohydrolase